MSPEKLNDFLKEKKNYKKHLSELFSVDTKKPLVAIILDEDLSEKDKHNLEEIMLACSNIDVQVVLLADMVDFKNENKGVFKLEYSQDNRHKLIAAADMAISFKFSDIEEMLVHGTIPIVDSREGIENYNPNSEKGNAFVYSSHNVWSIFAALIRATETFKFPYDWKNLMKQGVESMQTSQKES